MPGSSCTFGGKRAKTATPVALARGYDAVTVANPDITHWTGQEQQPILDECNREGHWR